MYTEKYFGLSPRITKWKEVSEFEKTLSESAELNIESRRLFVEYYKHINPEYYTKGREIAFQMYKARPNDFTDTQFEDVYIDMVYCLHRYGLSFQDYCIYRLINKSERCRQEFVSDKLRYHYCDILNDKKVEQMMTNKFECYRKYSKFYKRDVVQCVSMDGLADFIKFTNSHKKFIYKPLKEHSGHGITIVDTSSINSDNWYRDFVMNNPGVVEELIVQGDEMNLLNPSSINSCRIVTFTIGDEVTIIGGALRMGVGNAFTDNAGAGGIYASIDIDNGFIQSDAKNYLNHHFKIHPTTGVQIVGFRLPKWDDAKNLIRSMALHQNGTTLVAWDIAYSKDGWCMVEANDNGDWSIIQSNMEIGKKHILFELMDKYFKRNKTSML